MFWKPVKVPSGMDAVRGLSMFIVGLFEVVGVVVAVVEIVAEAVVVHDAKLVSIRELDEDELDEAAGDVTGGAEL
jgi:hypothetical protein